MKAVTDIYKKVDLFMFNKLDEFKQSPGYSRVQETIGKIDDEFIDIAKVAGTIVFILVPFIFAFIMMLNNSSMKDDISYRKEFITLANEIIANQKQIGSASRLIISQNTLDSSGGFSSRLSSILAGVGVDIEKIQVSNFESEQIAGTIDRSEGDFKFNALTTEELSQLFIALISKEKMKISNINIRKNIKTNLLNGTFRAVHFGKAATN
jgi:hypothetical protein